MTLAFLVRRKQSILSVRITEGTVNVLSYCASFQNLGTWAWARGVIFQSFDTTAGRPSCKAGASATSVEHAITSRHSYTFLMYYYHWRVISVAAILNKKTQKWMSYPVDQSVVYWPTSYNTLGDGRLPTRSGTMISGQVPSESALDSYGASSGHSLFFLSRDIRGVIDVLC